jgi:hypothetical protein
MRIGGEHDGDCGGLNIIAWAIAFKSVAMSGLDAGEGRASDTINNKYLLSHQCTLTVCICTQATYCTTLAMRKYRRAYNIFVECVRLHTTPHNFNSPSKPPAASKFALMAVTEVSPSMTAQPSYPGPAFLTVSMT